MNTHTVYTIGHSNRPLETFLQLLQQNLIDRVLDIRTVPKSRHNPQFGQDQLPVSLAHASIAYQHIAALGGLRRPRKDSPNGAWRNTSFRGYADYMQTSDFRHSVEELVQLSRSSRVVLMCAESVPWRCHRSMVADALTVRGVHVEHIIGPQAPKAHKLTPFAKVEGDDIIYPPELTSTIRPD